jgi:serine protease Do
MKSLRLPLAATGVAALLGSVLWNHGGRSISTFADEATERPPTLARAEELSSGFRWVAKQTLPSIVSVRTIRKVQSPQLSQFEDQFGGIPGGGQFDDLLGQLRERMREQQGDGSQGIATGEGSGFIVSSDGLIMTNAHVVRGADEVSVTLDDGTEHIATDIKADEFADVAVLRIKVDRQLPALKLGDDSQMEIGDWVLAFGSPFGLDRTVTQGIISAKSRGLKNLPSRQEFLQTDAAINPGNSGGPLVNLAGEVIGINTAIETRSGGYDGVGFAVPVSLAKWVGDQLANDGKVRRAYLGVKPDDVDSDIAKALELPTSKGVIVSEVTKGSPAEQAGVKVQDVILKLNNRAVSNRQQLITVAERLSIGESYPLVVLRDGKEIELTVVAAEFPEQVAQAIQQVDALGAEVQELTPELARELELDTDTGVVVTNVQRASLAARIGLRPGVVIARIGKMEVNTLEDFEKGLQAAKEKRQLVLLVKTANGTQLISVPFNSEE